MSDSASLGREISKIISITKIVSLAMSCLWEFPWQIGSEEETKFRMPIAYDVKFVCRGTWNPLLVQAFQFLDRDCELVGSTLSFDQLARKRISEKGLKLAQMNGLCYTTQTSPESKYRSRYSLPQPRLPWQRFCTAWSIQSSSDNAQQLVSRNPR